MDDLRNYRTNEFNGHLTTVPNDHISVAVFHGSFISISGDDHMGDPTNVPVVAHSESAG